MSLTRWAEASAFLARRLRDWKPLLATTLVSCGLIAAEATPAIAAPPPNDNFANATVLAPATSVSIIGTNVDATNEAGESICCWEYNTVWYRWTAPTTGNYRVEVCGSSFNTHVKVLTGTAITALQAVADNDDDPGCGADGKRSRLTFSASAGQEYKVQVGSQVQNQTGTISGSLTLVTTPTPAPTPTPTPTPAPTPTLFPNLLPSLSRPPVSGGGVRRSKGKYVLKVRGRLKLPPGYTQAQACNGTIILKVRKGKRPIVARTTKVNSRCGYAKTIKISRRKVGKAKKLNLTVRFGGNAYLALTQRTYKIKVKR